jgi:hypothetical protein
MAVKLNIGVSRKIGQPNYGSRQASIGLEVEVDSGMLASPEALQEKVRLLYRFADQAVEDELNQHSEGLLHEEPRATAAVNSNDDCETEEASIEQPVRGLTENQMRAIYALARKHRLSAAQLVRERFKLQHVEDMDIRQASRLIDELKSCSEAQ